MRSRIIFIAASIAILLFGFFLYSRKNKIEEDLLSSITAGSAVESVIFQPSFPSNISPWEDLGVSVVSNGEVKDLIIKNHETGETVAKAKSIGTLTRGGDGRVKHLNFLVQLTTLSDPNRNVVYWIIKRAAALKSLVYSDSTQVYTDEQLINLFPSGSKWILIPLSDTGSEFVRESIPEYADYIRMQYGDGLDKLRNYLRGGLTGTWNDPVPTLDIFYLYPDLN